ncbi:MAG: UDP-N-acetylglucosamine--N-acetylmuramyl-(pentapeptide) pyrophosphoryl-undecaprenol N-acetylglucosamine transferase, partial [Gammaproteobacteria bacterium]
MARPVLIMAGGTGGHVFPGLAVAEVLRARGVPVRWLGTPRGLENRAIPPTGIPLHRIHARGLRGKSPLARLTAPFMLARSVLEAGWLMLRLRPRAVLGMGGYVTGPGGLAAWLLRRPLYIHEQNAIAGLTNRLLAPLARVAMEAFPGSLPPRLHPVHTGNPVR